MNFETFGIKFAKIKSRNNDKDFTETPIYITGDKKEIKQLKNEVTSVVIPDENEDDEVIQHLPYVDKESGNLRQILYVSGMSGSGKSYYVAFYIEEYIKMFPKNKIILFSSLDEDKALDKFKSLIRVKLDEAFYNKKLTINDFANTLVVYDDTETISNPFIQEKLKNIMGLILTTGRKKGVFMIVTSHVTNDGARTKLILTEAHSITLFLRTMGINHLKYVLETTFGFNTKQINKLLKIESRWVTIIKTYPMTILHEKGVYVLSNNSCD